MTDNRWIPERCVTLSHSDQRIVEFVGKGRFEFNRAAGNTNQKAGPQSQYITERNGFGGEFAACWFFNAFPDFGLEGSVGGADFTLNRRTVDVKTTDRLDYNLIVSSKKDTAKGRCDLYLLVCCNWPHFQMQGFASADMVFGDTKRMIRGEACHFIDRRDLVQDYIYEQIRAKQVA